MSSIAKLAPPMTNVRLPQRGLDVPRPNSYDCVPPDCLPVEEAAARLGLTVATAWRWAGRGILEARQPFPGARRLITRRSIERFVENGRATNVPPAQAW